MPRIIDRYVIREILPPFLLALLVFTFILIIPFIIDLAETMIAKGVPVGTILQLMVTLLPQALALTIPMALLIGVAGRARPALGRPRVRGDDGVRHQPVPPAPPGPGVRASSAGRLTSWVMLKAMPDGNQTLPRDHAPRSSPTAPRARCGRASSSRTSPTSSLYVREVPPNGGWPACWPPTRESVEQPVIYLAKRGRMVVDRAGAHDRDGARGRHAPQHEARRSRRRTRWCGSSRRSCSLDPESVFPRAGPARGEREMTIAELQARAAELAGAGHLAAQPDHGDPQEVLDSGGVPRVRAARLALGASNRKDGKLASFVLGIARDLRLLRDHVPAQALAKGVLDPAVAGDVAAEHRARRGRRVPAVVARARRDQPIRISLPSWLARWRRDDGDAPRAMAPTAGAARRAGRRHARAALRPAAADAARPLRRASSTCASSA